MQKKFLVLMLVLYVASAAATYGVMAMAYSSKQQAKLTDDSTPTNGNTDESALGALLQIDPGEAKDQVCPLSGAYFTKTEKEAWLKRRPLAVMIENHPEARPQAGLGSADVVFEALAEGGVTRFMGIFLCTAQKNEVKVAPVRSARTYFVDWASGFNYPLYAHVGGANLDGPADALQQLSDYGWNGEADLNQFSIGYPTFVRDYNRVPGKEIATEHTMVSSTEKLWDYAAKQRGWTNLSPDRKISKTMPAKSNWYDKYKGWTFETDLPEVGTTNQISYEFWTGYAEYGVQWDYDAATRTYKRTLAGQPHIDQNSGQQIAASTVIVMKATEKGPIDESKHMLYGTIGTGDVLIFKDGQAIKATWVKKDREAELQFVDSKGKDVPLARGLIWISTISKTNEVKY